MVAMPLVTVFEFAAGLLALVGLALCWTVRASLPGLAFTGLGLAAMVLFGYSGLGGGNGLGSGGLGMLIFRAAVFFGLILLRGLGSGGCLTGVGAGGGCC